MIPRQGKRLVTHFTLLLFLVGCESPKPPVYFIFNFPPLPAQPSPSASAAAATKTVTNVDISAAEGKTTAKAGDGFDNQQKDPIQAGESPLPTPTPLPFPTWTPVPTPWPTVTPSPTPVPTPTPTPVPTATPIPTPTPTATPIPTPTPTPVPVVPASVSINSSANSVAKGTKLNLSATVTFSDGSTSSEVIWRTSSSQVATIDSEGELNAVKIGTVTVTATSSDETKQASLALNVTNPVVTFPGRIVYKVNEDLYLMNGSNENPIRLTNTGPTQDKGFPRLSWDGSQVAFSSGDKFTFTVATTANATPVNQNLGPNNWYPFVYFWHNGALMLQAAGAFFNNTNSARIWQKQGSASPSIYSAQPGQIAYLGGITANGVIVYEQGGHVRRCNAANNLDKIDLGDGGDPKIAQNLNPNLVVFHLGDDIWSTTFAGERRNLTSSGNYDAQPSLSPDESKIVFVSTMQGDRDLYIMNADGTNPINITNTPDFDEKMPDWGN